jgi:hypothetical protein
MLSVMAVYDGKEVKFREEIKIDAPRDVIVIFLDQPCENIKEGLFSFLNNPDEDVYSDNDLKIKY